MSYMQSIQQVEAILQAAQSEIYALAKEVGIDGQALLSQPFFESCFIRGKSVPVLDNKYKGKCYVLFRIFQLYNGTYWSYLQLYTFKHGGLKRVFNGARWLRSNNNQVDWSTSAIDTNQIKRHEQKRINEQNEAIAKQRRHDEILKRYQSSEPLISTHSWVRQRFPSVGETSLWHQSGIRVSGKQLLVPITNIEAEIIGFHEITLSLDQEYKRHYVKYAGTMTGAFIRLQGYHLTTGFPPILCEGLATGLTLALCASADIYVALSANNLQAVRQRLSGESEVLFCYDDDQWKPEVGNAGYEAARQARQQHDVLCGPKFTYESLHYRPTDFNDLHQLEGIERVIQQLSKFR